MRQRDTDIRDGRKRGAADVMSRGGGRTQLHDRAAPLYRLYAVLVHAGMSANMGHYYCYVRSPAGAWYSMNDSHVRVCAQPDGR